MRLPKLQYEELTPGVVDLIGSVGYFSMLQIVLDSAEVDLQPDREPPFPDVRGYRKVTGR